MSSCELPVAASRFPVLLDEALVGSTRPFLIAGPARHLLTSACFHISNRVASLTVLHNRVQTVTEDN